MRIIIGGAGRVGTELARALRAEEMDVVLVDSDSRAVKNAQNLDVLVIHGDLTTREKLDEAGIGEAEIFVAATNSNPMVTQPTSTTTTGVASRIIGPSSRRIPERWRLMMRDNRPLPENERRQTPGPRGTCV